MISFNLQAVCDQYFCLKAAVVFDYSKADWEGLNNYLLDCNSEVCYESDNVEEIWAVSEVVYE